MSRGPITGTVHALPVRRQPTVSEVPEPRRAPPPPKGLRAPGKAAWRAVQSHAPLLLPALDGVTVERFCALVDERAAAATELARGHLCEEPIVTPTGQVVGTRLVANPVAAILRQLDKQLDSLCDRLGLVPAARARLGLTLTTAEKQAIEVRDLLEGRFKNGDDQ